MIPFLIINRQTLDVRRSDSVEDLTVFMMGRDYADYIVIRDESEILNTKRRGRWLRRAMIAYQVALTVSLILSCIWMWYLGHVLDDSTKHMATVNKSVADLTHELNKCLDERAKLLEAKK